MPALNTKVRTYVELTKATGFKGKMFSISNRRVLIDDFIKDGSTAERVTEQVTWRGKNGKQTVTELSREPLKAGDYI